MTDNITRVVFTGKYSNTLAHTVPEVHLTSFDDGVIRISFKQSENNFLLLFLLIFEHVPSHHMPFGL